MKRIVTGIIFTGILLSGACSTQAEHTDTDVKSMVYSYSTADHVNTEASITSDVLIVNEDGQVTETDLPEDEFFVSIAPFIDTTHPCEVHSLTGCQGELTERDFKVIVRDEDGNTVVDEEMTSLENGFIDLWLPRDREYRVEVRYEGLTAENEISTFKGDDTCITTMQLTRN